MSAAVLAKFIEDLHPAFEAGDPAAAQKSAEAACVGLVQDQYRAVVRGDFAAFLVSMAEDIELENIGPPAIPFVGCWRGRAEVAEAIRRNFSWLEDQQPEVLTVVAQGDTVIVIARERGRFKPTGRAYDMHWVQQFTFKDGRVARFRQVFDSASLLDAITGPNTSQPAAQS
ncbi:nuclear transport factor 2 family protein [Fimbriiglobus ruber]|uniref:Ketosteroid isomerase-related protein n=1 Tax=Fimbriiglobus ruber TaxID=1908690 RepID=A0A225DAB5_9BACT|nr:nuclear transport factor 2 family protein [Fimbriiglobus ruber]OWK36604.1 Ketosteroid isomerase-related protein [Fimbriiglobus ruber]